MTEPVDNPPSDASQIPAVVPIVLGYSVMPRRPGRVWLSVQYWLSLILAAVGGAYLLIGAIATIMQLSDKAGVSAEELLANTTGALTISLPLLSLSLWLRQRVVRLETALEPSASLGRFLDALYTIAPWFMMSSGAVILVLGGACALVFHGHKWESGLVLLGIIGTVGAALLAGGLAMGLARRGRQRMAAAWDPSSP